MNYFKKLDLKHLLGSQLNDMTGGIKRILET